MVPSRTIEGQFSLNGKELDKYDYWLKEHKTKCEKVKASDSQISITFSSGSGIGTAVFVKCTCGEECNITDYDSW